MGEFVHTVRANLSTAAHLVGRAGISLPKRAEKLAIVIIQALEENHVRLAFPFIQRLGFILAQAKVKMPLLIDASPQTGILEGWVSTIYVFLFKDSMT